MRNFVATPYYVQILLCNYVKNPTLWIKVFTRGITLSD